MKTIGIIGAGPVGLAVADVMLQKNLRCVVFDVGDIGNATYRAAAAFWTPFSCGLHDRDAASYSEKTLEHYMNIANQNLDRNVTGVEKRVLEMNYVRGTFGRRPEWSRFPSLGTTFANIGDQFRKYPIGEDLKGYGYPDSFNIRCEMTYTSAVVCVDLYIPWKKSVLKKNGCDFVLADQTLEFHKQKSLSYWNKIISEKDIDQLVFCMGTCTMNAGLPKDPFKNLDTFVPKKGIVAHIPLTPDSDEKILLFEGGVFETDTLYLVPAVNRFVLGGIVHTVGHPVKDKDWSATSIEKTGVINRALTFLPQKYHAMIRNTLGEPGALKTDATWRTGVRPMFINGPLIQRFNEKLFGKTSYYCFGHGGSGFTFCYDSAEFLYNTFFT
jgi:glycine/D-amino acid oxidase-like deaminating enzyme